MLHQVKIQTYVNPVYKEIELYKLGLSFAKLSTA